MVTDMLAAGLDYKERAEMLVNYVEALVNIYPFCKAVVFETSKKMLPREDILNCTLPKEMHNLACLYTNWSRAIYLSRQFE